MLRGEKENKNENGYKVLTSKEALYAIMCQNIISAKRLNISVQHLALQNLTKAKKCRDNGIFADEAKSS